MQEICVRFLPPCTLFLMFTTPMSLVAVTRILYKLCSVQSLNLLCVCIYVRSLPVCNCKYKKAYNSRGDTDLTCKKQHRQIGVRRVLTSGSLGDVMVRILAQNARDVGSFPVFGTIFPIFIHTPSRQYFKSHNVLSLLLQ